MAQNTIFTVDVAGNLTRMSPGAPAKEVEIQSLIARFPDLIGDDGELLTIAREAGIADSEGGSGRWSLDNLFVTRTGLPVLVEVKRASDTRIRREVVGQMLDYAANAVKHWPAGEMARSFAAHCASEDRDADTTLREFLGGDDGSADFWERVDANLKAGKLRLLFVADQIPTELARVVEFLNEQMAAEVLAVELKWFTAADGSRTLVPRVIGDTQRAAAVKQSATPAAPMLTVSEWMQEVPPRHGASAIVAAREFRELATQVGGALGVSGSWVALTLTTDDQKVIKPFALYPRGGWAINLDVLSKRPALSDPVAFKSAIDQLIGVAGPTSTGKLTGYPSISTAPLLDPARRTQYLAAWINLARLCQAESRTPSGKSDIVL